MDETPQDESALGCVPTSDDAATRAAWCMILNQLAAKFDAKAAQVCYFDFATPEKLLFEVTTGIDFNQDMKALYVKHGVADPRLIAAWDRPNEAMSCRDVVDEATLHSSAIYKHVLKPLGIEYMLWTQVPGPDRQLTVWGVMRGPEGQPFGQEERQRFTDLVPTFKVATEVHRQSLQPAGFSHPPGRA